MSVCARFGSAFLLAWAAFGTAFAGAITVDTTAYLGATSTQPISCDTSQSSTQSSSASATSACGDGLLISTAAGSLSSGPAGLFTNIQANAGVESVWNIPLSDYGSAAVDASYAENLLITGGSGSGSLILDFTLSGQGGESGPETGGTLSGNISGGGASASFSNPSWTCGGNGVCSWELDSYPLQYVTIPFTFGVPFSFSEDLSLNAEAGNNGSASVSASLGISAFSVLDANGDMVSGAQVTDPPDAPEPGSLILCAGLLGFGAAGEGVRRRRVSRQRRRSE
ncbi:MAG: hypothetical protein ACLQVN_03305 [Bryobacteraceae bacterium]